MDSLVSPSPAPTETAKPHDHFRSVPRFLQLINTTSSSKMDYSAESGLEPESPMPMEVSDGSIDEAHHEKLLQGIFGGARRIVHPPATDIAQ